tara:strand:+ start:241 stop:702 length:462 start_codon:yes stop_codon:yes gene_type:complete
MSGIAPFQLFDENQSIKKNANQDSTKNIIADSLLSKLFFSESNIDLIQLELKKKVYEKTDNKYLIGRQSDTELLIVMRSTFLQNSKNLDTQLKEQIITLNNLVLNYCVDNVISGILAHIGYIKDIEQPYVLMEPPQNVNSAGTKTLRSTTSLI